MITRRLKDLIEEIEDWSLQSGDLRRETIEQDAVARRRLFLKAIGEVIGQALDEEIEFSRDFADQITSLIVGLEGCSPYLSASLIGKVGKILDEARNEIALCKQRIDGKIHLEAIMEFEEPRPDRVGMGADIRRRQRHQIFEADGDENSVDGLVRTIAFEKIEKSKPALLVGFCVGILGSITAGRVDQNSVFGKPPVAIASPADPRYCCRCGAA